MKKIKGYQAGGTVKGSGPKAPSKKGSFITVQKGTYAKSRKR